MYENPNPGAEEEQQAAEAAAETQTEQSLQDKAIDAFDEGAGVGDNDDTETEVVDDGGDGKEAEDGVGEVTETEEQKADREKQEAESAEAKKVDDDVKSLGLKGKAEERFRDLTGRLAQANKELQQYGGTEGLQRLQRDAEDQRQWDQRLNEIGCTPQQFGQAIGAVAAINSDDPAAWKQAHEFLSAEVKLLAKKLGLESGDYDPLSDHADLLDKVEAGAIDREDALEIARLRAGGKAREDAASRNAALAAQKEELDRAQQQGLESLSALGAELKQRDGDAQFTAVMKLIGPRLQSLTSAIPPNQWSGQARALYELAKDAGARPAAAPPRVGGKQPIRQSHATRHAPGVTKEHTDPMLAFDAGVEEARALGR